MVFLFLLQEENPGFMHHVYALSGVSGGSLGATIFTGLYADAQQENFPYTTRSRRVLSNDFLSPLNAALLFPDMFQKVLPFPIGSWDRSRWLEDAWATAYDIHSSTEESSGRMNKPFLDLWQHQQAPYQVPALLLNGTRAETGEKTIVSNIRIDHPTFSAIDVHGIIRQNIALKTATLLSARFPLVTPAGAVPLKRSAKEGKSIWGHVVDGGYIDNSGLETAMTLVYALQRQKWQEPERLRHLRVYLLYLKNSSPYERGPQGHAQSDPIYYMHETRAPLQAFFGSWDKGSESRVTNTSNYFKRLKATNPLSIGEMLVFELDRSREIIPLGWYLSEPACRAIDRQVEEMRSATPVVEQVSPFQRVRSLLPHQ